MHGYNNAVYNQSQYNALVLNDYITLVEALVADVSIAEADAVFMDDGTSAFSISNKGLPETVYLLDWFQVRRNNSDVQG